MFGHKEKENHFTMFDTQNDPLFSQSIDHFLEYFHQNPIVNSSIHLILKSAQNILKNKEIDIKTAILFLILSGNVFIIKSSFSHKLYHAGDLSIHLDETRQNVLYYKNIKTGERFETSEVLHIKFLNSKNECFGISPLKPLQIIIETHLSILKFLYKFIKNGGRPTGIISYKDIISPTHKESIKNELLKMHNAIGREGSIGVLEGEFTWEQIGSLPKDMQILEIKQDLEKMICNALGVPPILLGIIDAKFNHYAEAIDFFEKNTVQMYVNLIESDFEDFRKKYEKD